MPSLLPVVARIKYAPRVEVSIFDTALVTSNENEYGWGYNFYGSIGDNSTACKSTPVAVCGGLTFTNVATGNFHSLGVTNTGVAYAWEYIVL